MHRVLLATLLLAAAAPALAEPAPPVARDPQIAAAASDVSEARLRATIERLVAFGTRHTLSDRSSPTRGIGAAERWAASQFGAWTVAAGRSARAVGNTGKFIETMYDLERRTGQVYAKQA